MRRLIPAVLTSLALSAALVASASPSSAASPPSPRPAAGIEAAAAYVPQVSCDTTVKPGTASFAALLTTTYPGTTAGTVRDCLTDGASSEHYDGRAIDWMTSVRTPEGLARGNALVGWLLATDAQGNPFANARRLGVMYIIWGGQIWGAYRPSDGWRPYSSCASHLEASWDTACHRDHVHLSLSWEGAMGRTSYWTGAVASRDYGPCRVADLTYAPPYTTPRSTSCQSVPMPTAPSGASALTRQLLAVSGMLLRPGSAGTGVAAVNQRFGLGGSSWTSSTSAAVQGFQRMSWLPVTGVMDVPTWRALIGTAASSPRGAVDGGGVGYRSLSVRGWAFDPETTIRAIQVRVTVDGTSTFVAADESRPDVGAAFPGMGDAHGFSLSRAASPGSHRVCVSAVNVGAGQDTDLGCRDAAVAAEPLGHLDDVSASAGRVTLSGWVMDPTSAAAVTVRVVVDGRAVATVPANGARPDVALAYPGAPSNTGYTASVPVASGAHTVCAVGVNVGAGRDVALGCAQVRVVSSRVKTSTGTVSRPRVG